MARVHPRRRRRTEGERGDFLVWLHMPSTCCPSVPASECTTLDSEQLSMLERFVTSSGKPSPRVSWLRSWTRNAWMRRLCGLTLPSSTLARGAESWMQSLRACRASLTPQPENASATMITGAGAMATDLSPTSCASSRNVSPPWSSLRTCQPGLLEDGFDLSERNYADWVTRSKDLSFSLRRTLAHRISASACGSWPTSRAEDSESCGNHPGSGGDSLTAATRFWSTPNTPNGGRSVSADVVASRGKTENGKRQVGLESETKHWQTPRSNEANGSGYQNQTNGSVILTLTGQSQNWHTPHGMAGMTKDGKQGAGGEFAKQVERWASPRTSDTNGAGAHGDGALDLRTMTTTWATPCARIVKGGGQHNDSTGRQEPTRHAGLAGGSLFAPAPSDRRWPAIIDQWAWLAPATQSGVHSLVNGTPFVVDASRRHQLRALGNGGVPLCSAVAFAMLARRIIA